jgi:hypothetical protein
MGETRPTERGALRQLLAPVMGTSELWKLPKDSSPLMPGCVRLISSTGSSAPGQNVLPGGAINLARIAVVGPTVIRPRG